MFRVYEDNSIYANRGDIVCVGVNAVDMQQGTVFKFQPGDVLRVTVYGKKEAEEILLQRDFPVSEICETVSVYLDSNEMTFGEVISKPKDYWYDIKLNPETAQQTIVGYFEDGAVLFKLFPESADIENYRPEPEDFPVVDEALDSTSPRPVANRAVTAELVSLRDECERTRDAVAELYVTPEMFGAIGDGKSDDTKAIQEALDSCEAFDTLRFQNKTYCVSEPLLLNKKVNISGEKAVLKATKEMDCVVHLTNQGALYPSTITRLMVDANNLATVGFKIGGEGHVTQITFRDCVAQNAVSHGFHVLPVAYCLNFVSCLSMNNGGDGLNCVAPGSDNQINAVNIEKCSFQRNTGSGMNVNGVNFSITECDSEFNKYGITVGGVNYITYGVFVTNCHFEYNTAASVYVDTKSAATVTVTRCYLLQANEYNESTGETAFIKCSASSIDISLYVDDNTYQGNSNLHYVDGGNKLGGESLVRVENVSRLSNMKFAQIETVNTSEKYLPVPVSMSSGAGFTDCRTSVNLVGASKQSIKMVVPYDLVNALPRMVGVYVETDGTTAVLRCLAKKYNADGQSVIQQTYFDKTIEASGLFSFNLLNNWGYKRIPNNAFMEIEFEMLSAGNANSFVLSNPYITAYL